MKLSRVGLVLSLSAFAFVGCESAEGEPGAEGEQPAAGAPAAGTDKPAEPAAPAPAPTETASAATQCGKLLEAIKAKNVEGILALSTDGSAEAITAESVEMIAAEMGDAAACGEEKLDGEKATVAVTAAEGARDIPFAKVGTDWKFDTKTYAEKYPPKKGKGKKGKKEKAKKGKKGKK
jgi:hypothetical protein